MRFKIVYSLFVLSFLLVIASATVSCTGGSTQSELSFDSLRIDTVIPFSTQSSNPAISISMKFDYAASGAADVKDAFNSAIIGITPALTEGEMPFGQDECDVPQMMRKLVDLLNDNYHKELSEFVSNYDDINETSWLNYEANYEGTIVAKVNQFLSYQIIAYFYTGGAHGSTICNYRVFDTAQNSVVQLGDIVSENTRPYIAELMANKPSPDFDGKSLAQMKKEGYFFEDAVLDLPDNFFITEDGITFVFQQYEIAPYAMGIISVDLTWEELQPLLPKESVVLSIAEAKQS
ncbi:MAG: DUF3298 domain-containing protein [Bacteroidales bacterium]|nr:DUF3298 domain-containing protein [Bacteroidales bacterium]